MSALGAERILDAQLASIVRSSDDAIIGTTPDGVIVTWNLGAERLYGYPAEEVIGRSIAILAPQGRRFEQAEILKRVRSGEHIRQYETKQLTREGAAIELSLTVSPIKDRDGTLIGASTIARDVTERNAADEKVRDIRARLKAAFDDAPIGMALVSIDPDSYGYYMHANQAFCELTGYSQGQLRTMSLRSFTHADDVERERELMDQLVAGEIPRYEIEKRYIDADRQMTWVMLTASLVSDEAGTPLYCIKQVQDIAERKRFEGQLAHLADHDPLTGLFNRRRFERELSREISDARRYGGGGAVLIIDIDNFKQINDTLGHNTGDEVMTHVAHLLRERLRETDVLARLGGDEFGALLPHARAADAEKLAHALLDAVRSHSIALGAEQPTRLTTSVGVAPFGNDREATADDLLIEADLAMYDAKQEGRDRVSFASPEQRERMAARQTWTDRIREALEDDLFVLCCQPILDLKTNTVSQHELLLRMPGDHDELILPSVFLYTAERCGLIRAIDRWVLAHAIELIADQRKRGRNTRLEVNISGASVTDSELPPFIEEQLKATSTDPANLILEVTETAAIANIEQATRFITRLADIGCSFALDDFGAGFGSFYYLKHLPFDYLKIDGEFIQNLAASATDRLILKSIVELAKGLAKQTIAEFVGDQQTIRLLQEQHVDYAQGYHIGRPRPLSEMWAPVSDDAASVKRTVSN